MRQVKRLRRFEAEKQGLEARIAGLQAGKEQSSARLESQLAAAKAEVAALRQAAQECQILQDQVMPPPHLI